MTKTIVLCIDRDNDIGIKTGRKGPIIGVEDNLKIAKELALEDPEDTDVNALFGAIKTAKELRTEIATITGDRRVGITSDTKLSEQLDEVIKKLKPESVVLVTDGEQDEEIIPIVQSRIKINSIQRIIVRQSKELEKAYFTILHFIQEASNDPTLARMVFGIPGLILLLLAIGGIFGAVSLMINVILALTGLYLIIKGLGWEEDFFNWGSEFIKSLSIERISIVTYVIAIFVFIIGIGYGFEEYSAKSPHELIDILAVVLMMNSGNIILLALLIAIVGRIIDDYAAEKYIKIRKYIILLVLIPLIKLIGESWANYYMQGTIPYLMNFSMSILISIVLCALVIRITERIFMEEIKAKEKLIKDFANKKVYDKDGKLIGNVSKVLLDGSKLIGIKIGRRKIPKEDIISNNGAVMVEV